MCNFGDLIGVLGGLVLSDPLVFPSFKKKTRHLCKVGNHFHKDSVKRLGQFHCAFIVNEVNY